MNQNGCQDGRKIRRLRGDRTVAWLAGRVGITPQSLSNIELENKPASISVIIGIARELGVSVDAIIKDPVADDAQAAPQGAAALCPRRRSGTRSSPTPPTS